MLKLLAKPGFCFRPVVRMCAQKGTSLRLAGPSVDQDVGALLGDVPMVADTVPEPRPLSLVDPLASEVHRGRIAVFERAFYIGTAGSETVEYTE
jgi:hypothetical protein